MKLIIGIYFILHFGQPAESSYMLCLSETSSQIFTLKSDSSLVRRASGEGWKGKNRAIGRWEERNGLIIWKIQGTADRSHEIDTLRRLQFLVPISLKQKWQTIKLEIEKSISTDADIQIFGTIDTESKSGSHAKDKVLAIREFEIALTFICGSAIMIRKLNY